MKFRYPDGLAPNLAVILYSVIGWSAGIWMLTQPGALLNAVGVVLTAHALVISAFMIHDCAHHAIFSTAEANDRLGMLMSWINGACIANYQRLKKKHLRHHADRMDVVTFDYRATLKASPTWTRKAVLAMEWAYIPAVELLVRGLIVADPFSYGTVRERVRLAVLLIIRAALFVALAFVSVKAVLLYAVAYLLFLNVMRFMDAFQHTYDVFPSRSLAPAPHDPKRTRQYEYENTYSNVLTERLPWINVLVLNFGYHNAHHAKSGEPWYRLPALHRSLYSEQDRQVIPCGDLLATYHRHRVARVMSEDYGAVGNEGERTSTFVGAVGVSFLTAV